MSRKNQLSALAVACAAVMCSPAIHADDDVMGNGLRDLVQDSDAASPNLGTHMSNFLRNDEGDVLVHVQLKPGVDGNSVIEKLKSAGLAVTEVSRVNARHVEGFLPLRYARTLANLDIVRSLNAERPPMLAAGSVQSQAVALEKADIAHAHGLSGENIRIAALSDSFNACPQPLCITTAEMDIASGDLPKSGVAVFTDLPVKHGTDEGRAMLQLIHDIAPKSHLAFATGYYGQLHFGNSILKLREKFNADVITDDLTYFEEPFYSDSLVSQSIDQAVSEGAAYFSSAGNNGFEAYEADYQPMPYAQAVKAEPDNLHLEEIPENLRPKSVHVFSGTSTKGNQVTLSDRMTVGGSATASVQVDMQWDEPFDLGKVNTDYNIYIFDSKGHFIDPKSADVTYTTDDNVKTDHAMEYAKVGIGAYQSGGDTFWNDYQIVIGKMNSGGASKIKFVAVNTLAELQFEGAPSVIGHAGARGAQGVAATFYAIPEWPEDFSSAGPVTVYFDNDGNRLPQPDVRQTPQITAADGVNNTFFGPDTEGDGHPNFSGTSAAAPDAAGVAALVIEAAGGHGSIAPSEVYQIMQHTAHTIPLANMRVKSGTKAGPVTLSMHGDWTRWNNYYELSLDKNATGPVAQVDLDLNGTDSLLFNSILTRFYLGASKGVTRDDITYTVSSDQKVATLVFASGSFSPDERFHFGTSVYNNLQKIVQEDADRMKGLKVTVTMEDGTQYSGVVETQRTHAYNRFTGAGLIDAAAAAKEAAAGKVAH